jgi:quinone-modifying oxidoreductase subunit QmoB
MDKKYGAYICTGCGIGESLDTDALKDVAAEEGFAVQTHAMFCGKAGVEVLKKDIAENGINTLLIAACSRRVNFDVFRFEGCIVDRVNLREQVVWSHPRSEFPRLTEDQKDDGVHFDRVQMLADDYLKMGMARVKKVDLPAPYKLDAFNRRILVIGGGITGLSAALEAASTGYEVTLVEKENELGGHALHWRKQLPQGPSYQELGPPVIAEKIQAVQNHPNITVRTGTMLARLAGEPGDLIATFKKPGEKIEFDVPYPLPEEMRVDDSGKELNAEQLHERYMEYNKGRKDILTLDPAG